MGKLDAAARKALPKSDFAIPSKAPGSGSYPIEDANHARDALARAAGKPEQAAVDRAVYNKYPELKHNSSTAGKSNAKNSTKNIGG